MWKQISNVGEIGDRPDDATCACQDRPREAQPWPETRVSALFRHGNTTSLYGKGLSEILRRGWHKISHNDDKSPSGFSWQKTMQAFKRLYRINALIVQSEIFSFVTEKILRCTANNVSKFLSLSHHWEKSGFVCVDSWIKDGGSLEPIFFFKHISRSTNPSFGVPFKKRHARNKNQRPLFNRNDRNVPLKQNLHSTLNPPLTTRKRVFSHPLVNSHCKS